MAYLGRISAVLTANVADFTRGIGDARREIQSFAQSARNIEVRLNTRALDESLTRLQRFTRTLDEIRDLQARGVDAGLPDPNRLRDQFRAYEDLGRGITRVKDSIEGLSTAAQAGLLPALEVLQSNFQNVYNSIRNGTTTYDEQRDRVEALRESLARLTRQQSAVAAIGNAARRLDVDNTGASFVQPQALEALQRTLTLRNQAEQVPARLRGSVFNELSVDAQRNADLIERQAARVSRALLDLGNGTGSRQAVQASQSLLDSLVQRQRAIIAQFETELRSVRITGIVDPEVGNEAENLTSRLESLSEKLRGISTTKFDPLIAAVGRIVEQFNRAATSADKAKAAVNSLAAVEVSENLFTSSADSIKNRLTTETERNREAINRAASQAIASIEAARNIPPPNAVLPSLANMQTTRDIALVNARRDAGLAQEDFRSDVVPRVERLARDSIPLGDEFTNKAASIRREALALSQDLQAAFEAAGQDPVVAAGALDKYKSGLERLGAGLDEFESKVRRASAAQKQFDLFLRASGGSAEKLDPALARAATDIVTARQFTGQFSEDNIQGRVEVAQAVAQAERDILKLTQRKSEIDDDINLTTKARSALLAENTQQVKAITKELLTLVAASSGGIFDEKQVQAAADRLAKSTGSFGAAGFNNFNLAIQQSLFAVDDLISSTGPLEYKLRAVGNNISQLGLTLGQSGVIPWLTATKGLAIGVGAVLAGQLAIGLYRYATAGVEASDKAKALTDSLQRQKTLADRLADSFRNLGQSLTLSAFTGGARSAEEFRRQIQALRDDQKKLLEEPVSSLDPAVVREREIQAARSRELEKTTNVGRSVILRRELEQSLARERAAAAAAFAAPQADLGSVRRRIAAGVGEQARTQLLDFTVTEPDAAAAAAVGQNARRRFLGQQPEFANVAEAEAAVRRRLDDVTARSRRAGPQERLSLDAEAQQLAADLASLQRDRLREENEAQIKVVEQVRAFGLAIEQSQSAVEEAIRQGVPNAILFSGELLKASRAISQAEADFRAAGQQLKDAIALPQGTEDERAARDAAIESAQARERDARNRVAVVQANAARLEERAAEIRTELAVDPQRAFDAIAARATSNLQDAGAPSGRLARDLRILQARRAALVSENNDQRTTDARRQEINKEIDALNANVSAIEAATLALSAFSDGLNRASQSALANVQSAQQDANEARRRNIRLDTPQTRAARESADRALERQRDAQRRAERDIQIERGRLEDRIRDRGAALGVNDPFARIRDINTQLASGELNAAQREALLTERDRLQAAIQDLVGQFDAAAGAISDIEERVRQVSASIEEGRQLTQTPAQRAGEQLAQQLESVRLAFADQAEQGLGLIDQAGQREAQQRVLADNIRQVAPLRAQFTEEVANAVLQGPSRAALQASDATTVEGNRELSRLLRGDDPARDVNLIELQRQTQALEELLRIAREQGVLIAE